MNKPEIETYPVTDIEADTRQICEIRFDCLLTMHDVAYIKSKETLFGQNRLLTNPQWFRTRSTITLEQIKYEDPYVLGLQLKEMYRQLEEAINRYEQHR